MKVTLLPLSLLLAVASAAFSQTYTSGDWSYTLNASNEAAITSYNGSDGAVTIPSSLDGNPVKQVGVFSWLAGPIFNGDNKSSVTSVTIPNGVSSIGWYAFAFSGLTSVEVPDSVTSIGNGAFMSSTNLARATIGNGVTRIEENTFADCSALTSVTIGRRVTTIGNAAFQRCSRLTSVTIPRGVTRIGDDAFFSCQGLRSLYFQGDVPSAGVGIFRGINQAGTVYYPRGNTTWGSEFGGWWDGRFYIQGWPVQPYDLAPAPSISLEEPAGISLSNQAASETFGHWLLGASSNARVYTIRNTGTGPLNSIALTKAGSHANDFAVAGPATNALAPGASTTFSVSFAPTASGTRTAQISIASNDAHDNPFVINLQGYGLTASADFDADGLNDVAEFLMKDLGFDWQIAQPNLVGVLFNNAQQAGLYTSNNVSTNPSAFGLFTLSQYNANRTNGRTDVTGNPSAYSLFTQAQLDAARANGRTDVTANPSAFSLYTQKQFDANRTNGRTDVTGNPSAFGLFTQTQYDAFGTSRFADGQAAVATDPSAFNLFTKAQLDANRTNGRSDVTSNPSAYGLYTRSQFNANRTNGRTDVIRNPSSYSLVALTNVPSIRLSTKRGNTMSISMPGSWTRYAQSGMPRGWRFDTNKGILQGTIPQSGMPSIRLTPYKGSSPGAQVTVQFQPTAN